MRSTLDLAVVAACAMLLSACGDSGSEDKQVTQTRMDDIDALEGTISDDIINTDESTDEPPLDAPPPVEPKTAAKPRPKIEDAEEAPQPAVTDGKAVEE